VKKKNERVKRALDPFFSLYYRQETNSTTLPITAKMVDEVFFISPQGFPFLFVRFFSLKQKPKEKKLGKKRKGEKRFRAPRSATRAARP
jgi:hypothetical protein